MSFNLFRYYLLMVCSIVFLAQANAKSPNEMAKFKNDRFPDSSMSSEKEKIILKEEIGNYFSGKSTLHLRQILKMDQEFRGMDLERIVIIAQSRAGHGKAHLEMDGLPVGSQETISIYSEKIVLDVPNFKSKVGLDFKNLTLELKGNIFIESVKAVLKDKHSPSPWPNTPSRPRIVGVMVNRPLNGIGQVSLAGVFSHIREADFRNVLKVTIIARAMAPSEIKICKVTGSYDRFPICTLEKRVDRFSTSLEFRPSIARTSELMLLSRGSMFIERIEIELD